MKQVQDLGTATSGTNSDGSIDPEQIECPCAECTSQD